MNKYMRKLSSIIGMTMAVVMVTPSVLFADETPIAIEAATDYTVLQVGSKMAIDIENATFEVISGENVVHVTTSGDVTGVADGTAIIVATTDTTSEKIVVQVKSDLRYAPSDVIDLDMWKLQMAIENPYKDNQVLEIFPNTENLQALAVDGFQYLDERYIDEEFFYAELDEYGLALVTYCPVGGYTTPNSSYPRTELREMIGSGNADNWGWDGMHILNTTQRVTEIPSNGRTITSQIHGVTETGGSAAPVIKVRYDGNVENPEESKLCAQFKMLSTGGSDHTVYFDEPIPVGQAFDTQIMLVDGVGYVTMTTNDVTQTLSFDFFESDPEWANLFNYFKAGNYVQDKSENTDTAAEVRIYALDIEHYYGDDVDYSLVPTVE
ncbi:MAG: hypothetical protein ATN35_12255 [Epulopiscium sp. Nele67-Bin004]|nr:MAG: hypothetical protein ATN35_12255 [Epulopiscium sp. Nele67-Bin004]